MNNRVIKPSNTFVAIILLLTMTKGEIDRLGDRIRLSKGHPVASDIALLQDYRQTFRAPIARVFSTVLKLARRVDKQAIVTFRIKRIDTIIEKLIRLNEKETGSMQLSRMGDIAGCRCILNTANVEKLYGLLADVKQEFGADVKVKDHINPPKDDGYRSLHVYVKDKETNKSVEIQIRDIKQHNWATLVEIVDLLYGTQYKERGDKGPLGRFLLLYSNAQSLSDLEFSEMLKLEKKKKVFEKMSGTISNNHLAIRRQWLKTKPNGSFFVIMANKQGSTIESFDSFEAAENFYYNKYLEKGDSNIVLTHLPNPDFKQISVAYSNYVLAMHAFFDDYRVLVSKKILSCVQTGNYIKFYKDFNVYIKNVRYYFKDLFFEFRGMEECSKDNEITHSQIKKWINEVSKRIKYWQDETTSFFRALMIATVDKPLYRLLIKNRTRRLTNAITAGQRDSRINY